MALLIVLGCMAGIGLLYAAYWFVKGFIAEYRIWKKQQGGKGDA
jgi:hypothetical protein